MARSEILVRAHAGELKSRLSSANAIFSFWFLWSESSFAEQELIGMMMCFLSLSDPNEVAAASPALLLDHCDGFVIVAA